MAVGDGLNEANEIGLVPNYGNTPVDLVDEEIQTGGTATKYRKIIWNCLE